MLLAHDYRFCGGKVSPVSKEGGLFIAAPFKKRVVCGYFCWMRILMAGAQKEKSKKSLASDIVMTAFRRLMNLTKTTKKSHLAVPLLVETSTLIFMYTRSLLTNTVSLSSKHTV